MAFVEIAKAGDIPGGTMKSFDLEGNKILITNYNGKYYAIANRCTHAGGDLSKGKLEDKIVTCPRHGSKFDVTTGHCVSGPAKKDESTYQVKVEGIALKISVSTSN